MILFEILLVLIGLALILLVLGAIAAGIICAIPYFIDIIEDIGIAIKKFKRRNW